MKKAFSIVLILSISYFSPAFSQNEKRDIFVNPNNGDNGLKQDFEGKKYTNTQLREKANQFLDKKDYEKALKAFDLVYFRIEEDFINVAYCRLMLGKLDEAKNNFIDVTRTAKNPKNIEYSKQMIAYINSVIREEAMVKSFKESHSDCLKKNCSWKVYYKNGKTVIQKSVPANNSKDIWRVEAQWKSNNKIISERWVWMDSAWINQTTAFYDFNQEVINKNLKEHREVQKLLYTMYKSIDVNCNNELLKSLVKVYLKEKDINIKRKIDSLENIIEQLNKELEHGGYYNWETPMEIKSVSQARKEILNLSDILLSGKSQTSCYLNNTEYLDHRHIFNYEKQVIVSTISQLRAIIKKYNT